MPVKTVDQKWSISDDPEPGFMVSAHEWYAYANRVKTLIDPIENPYGWAEVSAGFCLAMIYATATFHDPGKHAPWFAVSVALAAMSGVLTLFFIWLGRRMNKRHRHDATQIVKDMHSHCKIKAPHADHSSAHLDSETA
jgi:hypothetical protein